jgi:hypothetical protein
MLSACLVVVLVIENKAIKTARKCAALFGFVLVYHFLNMRVQFVTCQINRFGC